MKKRLNTTKIHGRYNSVNLTMPRAKHSFLDSCERALYDDPRSRILTRCEHVMTQRSFLATENECTTDSMCIEVTSALQLLAVRTNSALDGSHCKTFVYSIYAPAKLVCA